MATIDELRKTRIKKLEELRKRGVNPYPASIIRRESLLQAKKMDGEEVAVAGRLMTIRGQGKISFADIFDGSVKMQIVFKSDALNKKTADLLSFLDIGDFVAVQGKVGKTQAGEISVFASDFQIITKTLHPLPDKWYGLKDIEERYRKRYLDMLLNPEVRKRLEARSLIVRAIEKVYEITKVFRNEGFDRDHNPEFTMFEAQIAYQDYRYGMDIIEEIIEYSAQKVFGKTSFTYQGIEMDVKRPWLRCTMVEAIRKFAGLDPLKWKTLSEAKKIIKTQQIAPLKLAILDKISTLGEAIAFVFEEMVEEHLVQPTIVYDYPIEVSPLAKKCDDPRFTQRFEMFAFGSELGNNYSELN